jgi:hypothetical protein
MLGCVMHEKLLGQRIRVTVISFQWSSEQRQSCCKTVLKLEQSWKEEMILLENQNGIQDNGKKVFQDQPGEPLRLGGFQS